MSWILTHSTESTPGRRLVLLVLGDKAGDDGRNAYPSVETIAREARLSERGVRYALRALEAAGRIENLGPHPTYGTTEYRVCMETPGGALVAPGKTTREGGQTTPAQVSQIAPEPSGNPSMNQPPRPPDGGSDCAPMRPVGHRKRALTEWRLAVAAWGQRAFPAAEPGAVVSVVSEIDGRPTPAEVEAWARWRGEAWASALGLNPLT